MNDSEENSSTRNENSGEASEHISIPELDQDKDGLVGKVETASFDRNFEEKDHEERYYLGQNVVGHIWRKGIREIGSGKESWQEFQKYVSNNHKDDAADFAKGNIDWGELVRRIEDGFRDKIDD